MAGKTNHRSEVDAGSAREQLNRILVSPLFVHAQRLGRFLQFVVDETLEGRGERLNQYAIAVEVFDRDETFDPTVDAIVRVEAGRLRSKLLEYYIEQGRNDPVQLLLPKRGYFAQFQFQTESSLLSAEAKDSAGASKPARSLSTVPQSVAPIIAVLPFINLSSDPEQDYFADGITEDLITDLSQLSGLAVISRQSTFSYKGKGVTVQQVCDELGASVVVEGSVRKLGQRVRITAQLIEGVSGQHLWASRYDRGLADIFDVQDEVNQQIISALSLTLSVDESANLAHHGTVLVDAYDYVLRGMKEADSDTMEGFVRARYCFERALRLDPNYAVAYARLAMNSIYCWIAGWGGSREETLDKGFEQASRAVQLDDQLALAHAALCWAFLWQGQHDEAIVAGQRAIQCNPNDVVALERLSLSLIWAGDPEPGFPLIEKASRLNPSRNYHFAKGVALFVLCRYDEAIASFRLDLEKNPNFLPSALYMASINGLTGREQESAATVEVIQRISPTFSLSKDRGSHFKNPEDRRRFADGLRKAGLS